MHGNVCSVLICDNLCGAITAVISLIKHICPSVGEQLFKMNPELTGCQISVWRPMIVMDGTLTF